MSHHRIKFLKTQKVTKKEPIEVFQLREGATVESTDLQRVSLDSHGSSKLIPVMRHFVRAKVQPGQRIFYRRALGGEIRTLHTEVDGEAIEVRTWARELGPDELIQEGDRSVHIQPLQPDGHAHAGACCSHAWGLPRKTYPTETIVRPIETVTKQVLIPTPVECRRVEAGEIVQPDDITDHITEGESPVIKACRDAYYRIDSKPLRPDHVGGFYRALNPKEISK